MISPASRLGPNLEPFTSVVYWDFPTQFSPVRSVTLSFLPPSELFYPMLLLHNIFFPPIVSHQAAYLQQCLPSFTHVLSCSLCHDTKTILRPHQRLSIICYVIIIWGSLRQVWTIVSSLTTLRSILRCLISLDRIQWALLCFSTFSLTPLSYWFSLYCLSRVLRMTVANL